MQLLLGSNKFYFTIGNDHAADNKFMLHDAFISNYLDISDWS